MTFRYKWVLFFFLVQFIIWLFWRLNKKVAIFPNASDNIIQHIMKDFDRKKITIKNQLIMFGTSLLILSASGPQMGTRVTPIERKGIDLVIALDTSKSMDAEDVTPSRLSKAKLELGKLINNLKGDRVAIIVFAGSSHLYLPLTTDYEAALLFLNEIDSDMIPTQGTVLSAALNTAISAYKEDDDKFKVIVLVSDGEDHDGEAIQIANKASSLGLMINTVGVGSLKGGLIPIKEKNNKIGYKKNSDGNLITSVLNENVLKKISDIGNGSYFLFSNSADSYKDILLAIENMEKKTISTHKFSEYEDRFQLIGFLALICFIAGYAIPTKLRIKI
ncbi:MAG: hypothetical protein CMG60_03640 [Candidatus Marinimicrobia bacterium]|nr:hypothetical protein [Candidatus Neomarinimicrobiota bacterium]